MKYQHSKINVFSLFLISREFWINKKLFWKATQNVENRSKFPTEWIFNACFWLWLKTGSWYFPTLLMSDASWHQFCQERVNVTQNRSLQSLKVFTLVKCFQTLPIFITSWRKFDFSFRKMKKTHVKFHRLERINGKKIFRQPFEKMRRSHVKELKHQSTQRISSNRSWEKCHRMETFINVKVNSLFRRSPTTR